MPWKEKTMDQVRLEFVRRVLDKEASKSALCREYGISRVTGDKWIKRYLSGEKLTDRRRTPKTNPNKTPEEIEKIILDLRTKRPAWGPRKLKKRLEDLGYQDIPARSTIGQILLRNNYIEIEQTITRKKYQRFERSKPNELWQTDFKGHFKMLNKLRCHPLTVLDDHSRFSLCIDAKASERYPGVKKSFTRLFGEYGLPESLLCDNGNPWGDSKNGYTLFEIWLMQLEILPIHGRPYHPQTQGKEERFHLTLKKELLKYHKIEDLADAQNKFNWWRKIYNHERPHDAINLAVPASRYKPSKKKMPLKLKEPEYNGKTNVRKINYKGYITINRHRYYFSESFIDKYVELKMKNEYIISINYGHFEVAKFSLSQNMFVSKRIKRLVSK